MTAVPLASARERERGFNQAAQIAEAIALVSEFEFRDIVLKVRETRPQTGLSRSERYVNVTDAFEAPGNYTGQSIVLIDDVITTGATLLACAVALKNSGASSVYGLTVATGMASEAAHSDSAR